MYDQWQNDRLQYRMIHEDGLDPESNTTVIRTKPLTVTEKRYRDIGFTISRSIYSSNLHLPECPHCVGGKVMKRVNQTTPHGVTVGVKTEVDCGACKGLGHLTPKRYREVVR